MPYNTFKTEVIKQHPHTQARVTKITTPHGEIVTPAFMPVGTRAVVNCMTPTDLLQAGSQIILGGNTYHMLCAPGMDIIKAAGGMHKFMAWQGPMLTDSGGFQIFSLSKKSTICQVDEHGAKFKHPHSGKIMRMTPESSIQTQKIIGADIIMAFDQCTPNMDDKDAVYKIMQRTHRWLLQSKTFHDQDPHSIYGDKQALFGIIQGGLFKDLREESADYIVAMDMDGIAIGGETIGYDMEKTAEIIDWVRPLLPVAKTRYTMGVGLVPADLIAVAAKGIDIFDCVAPTRNARHGSLYCGTLVEKDHWLRFESPHDRGRILIKKSCYANDDSPVMENCGCMTCRHYSKAYLHYLFKEKSVMYSNLACIHNIQVMHDTCKKIREIILAQ
jgi:queuine tRNA-ribosyltransferase